MNDAVVFNCQYNGLSIIQELGRRGVRVHALDSTRGIGTYSKYARYVNCPDPEIDESGFIEFLIAFGRSLGHKAVLFPTNDTWTVAVSRHADRLAEIFIPCVAPHAVVDLLIRKQNFYKWAKSFGHPVPGSWDSLDVKTVPAGSYPLAAKPEYRRTASDDPGSIRRGKELDRKRLTVLKGPSDLQGFLVENAEYLPYFIFQEYIEGLSDCMYCVGIYAGENGEVLGLFTGRKVRGFPPDVGDCILGQAEEIPGELIDRVKLICKQLGYRGIAEFEFKRDAVTGKFFLIEINPRSWSWIGITSACGVNLPWMAYRDLTGVHPHEYRQSSAPTGSVKYVRILPDWWNCMRANRERGYPQWDLSMLAWLKSLRANRLIVAEFSRDDLGPFFFALRKFLKSRFRPVLTRGNARLKRLLFRKRET